MVVADARRLHDTDLDVSCQFVHAIDGSLRCLPWDRIDRLYQGDDFLNYLDSSCTLAVTTDTRSECERQRPPRYVLLTVTQPPESCAPLTFRVFRLGAATELPAPSYYRDTTGACVTSSLGGTGELAYELIEELSPDCQSRFHVYTLGDPTVPDQIYGAPDCTPVANDGGTYAPIGAEIPPSAFAALPWTEVECNPRATAGDRLKPVSRVADDGFQFPSHRFFDHELGTECYLQSTQDGTLRCLPQLQAYHAAAVPAYFADAACTRAAANVYACREDRYVVVTYPEVPDDLCSATVTRVYELAGQIAPAYVLDSDGACVEHAEDGDWLFREFGTEVPLETFVAFTSTR